MTVTNVPGPQFQLYLLGSQMVESYALVPLWQGHGIGIALFSYAGTVYWGFNADYDVGADVDVFTAAIDRAFSELHKAATSDTAVSPKKKGPKKRPPLGAVTADAKEKAESPVEEKPAAKKPAAKAKPAG
jgi:diacylglycerol O-acyltransferase